MGMDQTRVVEKIFESKADCGREMGRPTGSKM
jgi:hypothetical protein